MNYECMMLLSHYHQIISRVYNFLIKRFSGNPCTFSFKYYGLNRDAFAFFKNPIYEVCNFPENVCTETYVSCMK